MVMGRFVLRGPPIRGTYSFNCATNGVDVARSPDPEESWLFATSTRACLRNLAAGVGYLVLFAQKKLVNVLIREFAKTR